MAVKTEATLVSLEVDGDDIIRFCLKVGESIDFRAGQYARVTIENPKYTDERGNSRTLTLVSNGESKDRVCFATMIGKSAFKRSLLELDSKSGLVFTGPFGNFVSTDWTRPIVFIAGGIGITPVVALLGKLHEESAESDAVIFHLSEQGSKFPLSEEALRIISLLANSKYIRISPDGEKIQGVETGRLNAEKLKSHVPDEIMSEAVFHISGPNELVKNVKPMLMEQGVEEERIRIEIFPGY